MQSMIVRYVVAFLTGVMVAVLFVGASAVSGQSSAQLIQLALLALFASVGCFLAGLLWRMEQRLGQERARTHSLSAQSSRDLDERNRTLAALRASEDRYRRLVDGLPDCVWLSDPYGYILLANRRALDTFGIESQNVTGNLKVLELFDAEDRVRVRQDRQRVLEDGRERSGTYTCLRQDGTRVELDVLTSLLQEDADGALILMSVGRDPVDRRRAESKLRETEARLAMQYGAMKAMADHAALDLALPRLLQTVCTHAGWDLGAFWAVDDAPDTLVCREVWHNPHLEIEAVGGPRKKERRFRGVGMATGSWSSRDPLWVDDIARDGHGDVGAFHGALTVPVLANGVVYGLMEFYSLQVRPEEKSLVEAIVAISTHIGQFVERRRAETALDEQISRDAVTGLPNGVSLQTQAQQAVVRAARNGEHIALLAFQIEGLPGIEETFGSEARDAILCQIALHLRDGVRQGDIVARLGPDEFAVLLAGTNARSAKVVMQKLQEALKAPCRIEGQSVDVGSIAGLATYPDHAGSAEALFRCAERALQLAASSDRACATYPDGPDETSVSSLTLLQQLRVAVDNRALQVRFQPRIRQRSGRVASLRAALWWDHPERGPLHAEDFLPAVRNTGLSRVLTAEFLNLALEQCAAWQSAGLDMRLALPLPDRMLSDPELTAIVSAGLARWSVPAASLEIEVPENGLFAEPDQSMAGLRSLEALGTRITIRCFGRGPSLLSRLSDWPAVGLSIDRSLIEGVPRNDDVASIVESIIHLGHGLGLQVVADGVENQQTWDVLARFGCDAVQGPHVSPWLTGADVLTRFGPSRPGLLAASPATGRQAQP